MRGTVVDIFVIIIICFVTLTVFAFGNMFYEELKTHSDTFNFTTEVEAGLDRSFDVMDYGLVFFVGVAFIACVVSAFFIKSHPVFFIVSLLIFIMLLALLFSMTNMFFDIYQDEKVSTYAEDFPKSLTMMGLAPYIMLFFFIIVAIVMFTYKPSGGQRA